ncbi:F-box/kelch-repeat protein At1g57790-like [Mercurialis annua]|uniref:F-box/kelch-repeat protein At1g57790-like n=1 Tax=Mercurialis annua TaxID=3986 RepID=UPI00215E49BF|nr:F-box/kelch-repeat protein At1g57790-like [Mercurialis annua]
MSVLSLDATTSKGRWCPCHIGELPVELLLMIVSRISALDYIYARVVCKCWRSAFAKCLETEVSQSKFCKWLPFFLILKAGHQERPAGQLCAEKPILYTTGKFGDLSTNRVYTTGAEELNGTRVLLARYGWLLLFSSEEKSKSLFFFNPFSRARISLPYLNVHELDCSIFDISLSPTSRNCMIFAIWRHSNMFKFGLCNHEDESWTIKLYSLESKSHVVNTVLVNGIWYCLHENGDFSSFNCVTRSMMFLGQPDGMPDMWHETYKHVSYVIRRGEQVFLRVHCCFPYEIALKDPLEASIVSVFTAYKEEALFRSDVKGAMIQFQDVLVADSFSSDAWCGMSNSDGIVTFGWHNFISSIKLNSHSLRLPCSPILWFHPTWVDSSHHFTWKL